MSNKRRKSIGSEKIARNLAIRNRRGAVKLGNPLAGHGTWRNTWLQPHAEHSDGKTTWHTDHAGRILIDHAKIVGQTEQLRANLKHYTDAYWRGA